MNETLFLVCPSDCLEARINEQFNTVNYFYTSLGNSFNIDQGSLKNIQELITNHSIKNIYFVLSSDNRFILDALKGQFSYETGSLESFYKEIIHQKIISEKTWYTDNNEHLIISHFLNKKINLLHEELANIDKNTFQIKGLVYDKYKNSFLTSYSNLTIISKYQLN